MTTPTSETVASTTTTSTPNNVNAITSQSGGLNRTLTYDPNGNITSDGGTRTFEWDGANRLVAINYTGFTTRSEFTHDGLSRMVKIVEKTGSTINSTRKFVWHGQEKLEFRDATDAVTMRIFSQGQHNGTTPYFFTRDHLGSVREVLSGGGTVVARHDYDPFGHSTTILATIPTDMNFTGLYRHSKSNLDLAVFRAYDPDLGRWLNRDPIAEQGGLNLYQYAANTPATDIDPLGLRSKNYDTEPAAEQAGALADFRAAAGGFIEYGGWVCETKCGPGSKKQYYYTGPTRGHPGPPPRSSGAPRDAQTWSRPSEWEKCADGDKIVGAHYTHPNGSLIPQHDVRWANDQNNGKGITLTVTARRPHSPTSPAWYTHHP